MPDVGDSIRALYSLIFYTNITWSFDSKLVLYNINCGSKGHNLDPSKIVNIFSKDSIVDCWNLINRQIKFLQDIYGH